MLLAKIVPILLSDARIGAAIEANISLLMFPRSGGSLAILPWALPVPVPLTGSVMNTQ